MFTIHRRDRGRRHAVEGQPVVFHPRCIRHGVAWQHGPFLQDHSVVVIGVRPVGFIRMGDQKSDLPHHFLHGAVRVIEKRAFLMHGKLVDVPVSRCHGLLADPGHAVLLDGNFQTVPVQGSRFRQMIFENHTHALALLDLNRRSRAAPVVAPCVDGFKRHNLLLHRFGGEFEDLHSAVDFADKIRHIRRHHRRRACGALICRMAGVFGVRWTLIRRVGRAGIRPFCSQTSARSEQSRPQHCRVLKKFSSRAAHLCLRQMPSMTRFGWNKSHAAGERIRCHKVEDFRVWGTGK
jgi:hypothetical protein